MTRGLNRRFVADTDRQLISAFKRPYTGLEVRYSLLFFIFNVCFVFTKNGCYGHFIPKKMVVDWSIGRSFENF